MSNFCLVPESELEKLEETRKQILSHLAPDGCDLFKVSQATSLTSSIWKLANRKWKKVSFENPQETFIYNGKVKVTIAELKCSIEEHLQCYDQTEKVYSISLVKALVSKIEELQTQAFVKDK